MMSPFLSLPIRALAAAALCTVVAAPASAQEQPGELPSWHIPGWTFTPGIVFGGLYDSNVTLGATGDAQARAGDKLFQMEPFGQVEYFSPRTTLNGGLSASSRRRLQGV